MEPLLHNRRSTVVMEKLLAKLKKCDVALFKWASGDYPEEGERYNPVKHPDTGDMCAQLLSSIGSAV